MIKKELFIEGVSVPISDMGIDWVKEIADIENPDQRRSDYSKSIKIVGTKDVNKLFNHIYDVNVLVTDSFNPQKKADAVYYEDTIEQLRGFFRLVSIEVDNDVITYNGTLHGELSNIFKDMGDSLISELDWTDLNHTYNELAIRNSWVAPVGVGYFYPMVDYTGYAASTLIAAVTDFRPGVWFIEIWDRIFEKYGYTYDSTFIDGSAGSTFNRLLMLAKSNVITYTTQRKLQLSFEVERTGTDYQTPQVRNELTKVIFNDDASGSNNNTINTDYDVLTGVWTCSQSGTYTIAANIDYQFQYTGATVFSPNVIWEVGLIRERGGSIDEYLTSYSEDILGVVNTNDIYTPTASPYITTTTNIVAKEGDRYYFGFKNITFAGVYDVDLIAKIASVWSMTIIDNVLTVGSTISMGDILPNMKQSDFIMGVVKAFNLYIEQDGEKNLFIEPREDYYTDTVTDWTNKKNGGIKIEPNKQLQGRQYNFKFQKEGDYLHEKYLDDTGSDYGDLLLSFDNDFKTETKEIELPFGSTLLAGFDDTNDIPIASLYYKDPSGVAKQGESKPRMVYYGGMIGCVAWTFEGVAQTTYPYVGDTWSPYGVLNTSNQIPSILNFQRPEGVYYDGNPSGVAKDVAYGGRTLYSQYEQMIADIQNPVITADFYLSPMDIYNLSFRNRFFIDTAYYRLIKLSKSGDLYSGEFLKIG